MREAFQPDWLHERDRRRTRSLRTKAYLAQIALGASLIYWICEALLATTFNIGWDPPQAAMEVLVSAEVLYPLLLLVSAVSFILWSHAAHSNLRRLGRLGVRRADHATIWWWLVPLASFVVPYKVVGETARGSVARVDDIHWNDVGSPGIVGWWTGLFVSGQIVSQVGGSMVASASSLSDLEPAVNVLLAGSVLMIAAAAAGVGLIQKITAGQIDLANTLWPVADRFSRQMTAPAGHGSYEPPTHTG